MEDSRPKKPRDITDNIPETELRYFMREKRSRDELMDLAEKCLKESGREKQLGEFLADRTAESAENILIRSIRTENLDCLKALKQEVIELFVMTAMGMF